MTINEAQDEVIEEFSDLTDWMDKYQMLIDLGNELNELDEKYKTEQNLIDGCQSRVWLQCDERGGKLFFTADSDALIVKGIIALLIRVISGHTPKEILDADLYFIDRIGLREHLSPTRSNGLLAMVKQIKAYALALQREGRRVTGMRRLFFFITVLLLNAAPLTAQNADSLATGADGLSWPTSTPPTASASVPCCATSPRPCSTRCSTAPDRPSAAYARSCAATRPSWAGATWPR